jgi:ankyrin repeat protein
LDRNEYEHLSKEYSSEKDAEKRKGIAEKISLLKLYEQDRNGYPIEDDYTIHNLVPLAIKTFVFHKHDNELPQTSNLIIQFLHKQAGRIGILNAFMVHSISDYIPMEHIKSTTLVLKKLELVDFVIKGILNDPKAIVCETDLYFFIKMRGKDEHSLTSIEEILKRGGVDPHRIIYQNPHHAFDDCSDYPTPYTAAVELGNLELLRKLDKFSNAPEINTYYSKHKTPLLYAVEQSKTTSDNNLGVINYLLTNHKALVEAQDLTGRTAIMIAAEQREGFDVVVALTAAGADLTVKDENDCTALHHAARGGNSDVIKYLIDQKININAQDLTGRTAIMLAAQKGNFEAVVALIEAGADLTVNDKKVCTPLHWAAMGGNSRVIEHLTGQNKIDINAQDKIGRTAIMIAAEQREGFDVVVALTAAGADLTIKDKNGLRPFDYTKDNTNLKLFDYVTLHTSFQEKEAAKAAAEAAAEAVKAATGSSPSAAVVPSSSAHDSAVAASKAAPNQPAADAITTYNKELAGEELVKFFINFYHVLDSAKHLYEEEYRYAHYSISNIAIPFMFNKGIQHVTNFNPYIGTAIYAISLMPKYQKQDLLCPIIGNLSEEWCSDWNTQEKTFAIRAFDTSAALVLSAAISFGMHIAGKVLARIPRIDEYGQTLEKANLATGIVASVLSIATEASYYLYQEVETQTNDNVPLLVGDTSSHDEI